MRSRAPCLPLPHYTSPLHISNDLELPVLRGACQNRTPKMKPLSSLGAITRAAHGWLTTCSDRRSMAYPVRYFEPQTIYFVTSRTIQSRFLLAPSDKTNELVGGILARAVRQCEVEFFAYVFTSNHFHAMVRAPSAVAMSKFMQTCRATSRSRLAVSWAGAGGSSLAVTRQSPSSTREPRSSASSTF